MTRFIFILTFFSFISCSKTHEKTIKDKLVGTWRITNIESDIAYFDSSTDQMSYDLHAKMPNKERQYEFKKDNTFYYDDNITQSLFLGKYTFDNEHIIIDNKSMVDKYVWLLGAKIIECENNYLTVNHIMYGYQIPFNDKLQFENNQVLHVTINLEKVNK